MTQRSYHLTPVFVCCFWIMAWFVCIFTLGAVEALGRFSLGSTREGVLAALVEDNIRLRNEARILLNRLNHFEASNRRQILVSHGSVPGVYPYGGIFNTTVRASTGSGGAATSVIECAATERVLYRFSCPADVVAATTMTGVIDC